MTAPSAKIIRVGDLIRVVTSKFVKRVGYPLVWTELLDEVKDDPRTWQAWELLTGQTRAAGSSDLFACQLELPKDYLRVIAKHRVEERRFGGNERSLHYYKTDHSLDDKLWTASDSAYPDLTGHKFTVYEKKLAKTGKRVAPTSGRGGYWDDEDWYDPGGLEDCKTHILLKTHAGWIERCNVELVRRAYGSTDKYPAGSKYAPKSKIG